VPENEPESENGIHHEGHEDEEQALNPKTKPFLQAPLGTQGGNAFPEPRTLNPPLALAPTGGCAPSPRRRRRGFSLIEVTLALLVVGVGLVALLGLFPVGLRESGLATADTTQSIFANGVLNAIHANAGEITDWANWTAPVATAFTAGITNITAGGVQTIIDANGITGNIIRYQLEIGFVTGYANTIRYAAIRVSENRYSDISRNPVYYTEFRYEGE
jgi:prepilin-type N-terminal cleavage/methylation domain-containing protein